jgi:GAF domain-containing protein
VKPACADAQDPAAAFAELGALAVSARPLEEILQRTADLIRSVIDAPVEVSVTLVDGDDARTPAATAVRAAALDQAQYDDGYGPCLDSARAGQLVLIDDTAEERRWPAFAAAAAAAGVVTSLSVPLPTQRHLVGALNVYAREAGTFTAERVSIAERFATYAAVAIGNTALYLTSATLAAQLQEAMASRATIEQAKGILMAVHRCGPEEAFARLVGTSQRSHRKLREVARGIVEQTAQ